MKWICIFWCFLSLALSLVAQDAEHMITDAEQLEKKGETDSAIAVLKAADRLSPENIQITKLLARQYVMKVDDETDPAAKKTALKWLSYWLGNRSKNYRMIRKRTWPWRLLTESLRSRRRQDESRILQAGLH